MLTGLSKSPFLPPTVWPTKWAAMAPNLSIARGLFIKSFLYYLCAGSVYLWDHRYQSLIRSLPLKSNRAHRNLISGEALLGIQEEARVVSFLDKTAALVRSGELVDTETIFRHCLLAICYSNGLRPVQIGRINLTDLRVHKEISGDPAVHIVAHRAKKRNGEERRAFIRKVKRDWAPPFIVWHDYRWERIKCRTETVTDSVKAFPQSLAAISKKIADAAEAAIGTRRTATDFRHSAAQRLADAGASVAEVANFLGHSHVSTSLVYFNHSESQAAQVNRALAISPIYKELASIAATRTIDKRRLLALPPDNQVGAVPHGIPIAGIGACDLGQSLCEVNPALSCYTCRKFIPINNIDLHREALDSFRRIARFFFDESRGDKQSPAFMQLQITLGAIQQVMAALEPQSSLPESSHA